MQTHLHYGKEGFRPTLELSFKHLKLGTPPDSPTPNLFTALTCIGCEDVLGKELELEPWPDWGFRHRNGHGDLGMCE